LDLAEAKLLTLLGARGGSMMRCIMCEMNGKRERARPPWNYRSLGTVNYTLVVFQCPNCENLLAELPVPAVQQKEMKQSTINFAKCAQRSALSAVITPGAVERQRAGLRIQSHHSPDQSPTDDRAFIALTRSRLDEAIRISLPRERFPEGPP